MIRVIGHRWWWEVDYPDHQIVTANELVIPIGEPVGIELSSVDVIHSFWVPQLHGKMDMIPGRVTHFWMQADRPGIYRGQCAEYCGLQHAHMAFVVKALPPEQFVRWLESPGTTARPSPEQSPVRSIEEDRGHRLFLRHGCSVCHAIEGTPASGQAGPDLTRIAYRETLAAGTIDNTPKNLLRWLAAPQEVKPGAKMPATEATKEELEAIVTYLLSLDPSSKGRGGERE